MLYKWGLRVGDLVVHMISSSTGARALKLCMHPDPWDRDYPWEAEFSGAEVLAGEGPNRPLAEAVEAVMGGGPPPNLALDINPTTFQRAAWHMIQSIPFGGTATYGEIARRLGRPGAARAVGTAMARNPLPLIFP